MSEKIIEFISKQTCGTLCCVDTTGNPWCFSFFYSFNKNEGLLYYKSSEDTRHSQAINSNPLIAGTILPDKLNLLQIRGVQFEGTVIPFEDPLAKGAYAAYHKKYPFSIAMPGQVWTIRLDAVKFTDNSLGFGTKIRWHRDEMSLNSK
jgi:uncharacterized protein